MAAFDDKIQSLMDEVYTEWQKEENKGKDKRDVLGGFSAAHQIAVVFGNLNYQVENGGIEQWIYNGYFHDDAEKLIEYLEIGAETDKRCRTILDGIYKLDQYAQETDCDRSGIFYGGDGESNFIGEMMNCDEFDNWYYSNCGEENWWQVVCGIIDKVEGRESAPVHKDEHDGEITAAALHPLQVYIENTQDDSIGGFTMPLPTTMAALQPFLDGAEIRAWQDMRIMGVQSDIGDLGDMVYESIKKDMSPDMFDELNYLAAKIQALSPSNSEVFTSALEARQHCGSVAEIINLTENLDKFELQPAYSPEQYGDFLLDMEKDNTSEIIGRLENFGNPDELALVKYILRLEKCIDEEAYGRAVAEEEKGVFTKQGYLTEREDFMRLYRGPESIPSEYCVFTSLPAERTCDLVIVNNTDLSALLLEMHALGGEYMKDAKHNLQILATGGTDFFVMMNNHMLTFTPAETLFHRDTTENETWMLLRKAPDIRTFVMSVTERADECVTGNLFEAPFEGLQGYIRSNSFNFTHLDAKMKDGSSRLISNNEWDEMWTERDQVKSWVKHYDPADEKNLEVFLDVLRWAVKENRQEVPVGEFMSRINTPYMSQAKNPQPDMLRVTLEAAKEMLAIDATHVYRLHPEGMKKLSAVEAVRTGLWYSVDREFAVHKCDCLGIEKWAKRAAADTLREQTRSERKKSYGMEV